MNAIAAAVLGFLAFAGLLLVVAALIGFPVMWLWNALLPDIFGLKAITFWQAVGLALLCGLLFNSSSSTNAK